MIRRHNKAEREPTKTLLSEYVAQRIWEESGGHDRPEQYHIDMLIDTKLMDEVADVYDMLVHVGRTRTTKTGDHELPTNERAEPKIEDVIIYMLEDGKKKRRGSHMEWRWRRNQVEREQNIAKKTERSCRIRRMADCLGISAVAYEAELCRKHGEASGKPSVSKWDWATFLSLPTGIDRLLDEAEAGMSRGRPNG